MDHLIPHPEFYKVPFITHDFNDMPYVPLGRSGLKVSKVGLGTWKFGFPETGDGARVDEKTAYQIFDRAIELGVTHWDTANRYNDAAGNSERLIGRWLKNNPGQRRNVVIATKIFGGMDGVTPNHSRLSRANVLDSTYACLARMQVDYIDILYFHSYDPLTPPEESLGAVEDLIRRDLVRYFAVSNYTVDQIKLYEALESTATFRTRIIAIQNRFDILTGENKEQAGVLEYSAHTGNSLVAFSPLGRGLLTNRYLDKSRVGPGDRLFDEGAFKDVGEGVLKKLKRFAGLAEKWGYEINQLALAYMMTLPGMGPVIPASSSVKQLESNAAAGKIVLSEEQIYQIKTALVEG